MQKRYRIKKVLQNILTAISVLLVAVCLTGCEEPQSVPVLKTTTDEFTGTIINQTGHPVINISRSTI